MTCEPCDLVIVGGGPGGYAAALEGVRMGRRVTLVERGLLGGTCVNWGCIPTKLLLGATCSLPELASMTRLKLIDADSWRDLPAAFSLPRIQQRKQQVLQGVRQAMEKRLQQEGVTLIKGRARMQSGNRVAVMNGDAAQCLEFQSLILATGSAPAYFPGVKPDGKAVLSAAGLLQLEEVPQSLILVGAGAIGMELGDFFCRLGAAIDVVEALDRVVPNEDVEVGQTLGRMLKRAGWNLHLGRRVAQVATHDDHALLTFEDGATLEAEKALIAVGQKPNNQDMDLEAAEIPLHPRGWIQTDAYLRATDAICAVGDCNGRMLLAHAADHQGRYAVRLLSGQESAPYDQGPMPSCMYGGHEVMRSGPGLAALQKEGPVEVSRFMLAGNPIAQAHGAAQGFVKAYWREGRVRSVTAVGHGVSQLSSAASLIIAQGWTQEQARNFVFAHPTLDEALLGCLLAPRSAV